MTDSQQALKAIGQGYSKGSRQEQIARIINALQRLDDKDVHTNLRWISAHAGVEGTEKADEAAKAAANATGPPTRTKTSRYREVEGEKQKERPNRKTPGQHTWRIDKALPGKHTLGLYGALTSDQTSILI
jgi:ribonuclease HI